MNKKIKNYIFPFIDIILFILLISLKSVYFSKAISPYYLNVNNAYKISILCSIILISITFLFKSKVRHYLLYILNFLISLLLISDLLYYRINNDLVSMISIKNGFFFDFIFNNLTSFNIKDLFYLIDLIIIPFIINFTKKYKFNFPIKFRILITTIFLGICFTINKQCIKDLKKEQPGLLTNLTNKSYIANSITALNYHGIDIYNYINTKINNIFSKYDKEKIITNLSKHKSTSNKFSGYGKNKNLIIIQFESLQNFMINKKIDGKEITPNLNKFIKNSLYFNNCFYQTMDGNTSDAEFMVNNSIYPLPSGAVYYKFAANTFNSLPKMLNDKGYTSSVFHANSKGFWNRSVMYRSEKFNNFYGYNSFNPKEKLGIGISDEEFFNKSFEKITKLKKPFYSFLITLTSHYPFKLENYNEINYKGNELMKNYLNSIHYSDNALGTFLKKLKSNGLMDDSILVIYGDHNGILSNNIDSIYEFNKLSNKNEFNNFMYQQVPLMIHFPKDMYKGIYEDFLGQMDIYPTLANLFGINNQYMFGQDLLNYPKNNKVLFSNGSFIKNNTLYLSPTDTFYNLTSGNKISSSNNLDKLKENIHQELDISKYILEKNFIKNN